jgi:predicted AAA+ superfamily ATPase
VAVTNSQRVQVAMQLLGQGLASFVDQRLTKRVGGDWPRAMANGRGVPTNAKRDTHFLLKAMIRFWRDGLDESLGHSGRSWVGELLDIRNRWAHNEQFTTDQTLRALDTTHLLLNAVNAPEPAAEVDKMRQDLLRTRFAEEARAVRRRAATAATEGQPAAGLKPWREVVTPHPDVASGRYQQAEFAADLHQVWRDEAAAEYGKPEEFFRRTYLTEGLKALLLNATRRLRGEGGDPVVSLQTNFGGGKTHSLIALCHLAGGYPPSELAGVEGMLANENLEGPPAARIAVLVGQKISPGTTHRKDDGTEVRTIWGELAWQLGGRTAYDLVADADRTGTNAGQALTDLLRAHSPCLILIDEWVAYARQLYGVDGLPAGSFDTQFTFAQALSDAAKDVPNAMLVVSIPASDIETGGEGGRQARRRLENVVARMESSWKPATADEGFEIVRRRLFEDVPPDLARERDAVVRAFGELYRSQKGEFPSECAETEYERRSTASYPIHPELFDRLYGEWSTLERFQRTRGVLRLMASVIHELWERDDRSLLIMPGTMPIDAVPVIAELTRYLDEGWTPVIATDIDGENSLPLRLDRDNPGTFGRYSAARRVARTVYMGSAPIAEAANRGLDDRRIKLGCVQPGESPATFGDALRRLAGQATYLNTDGNRYWYSLQPTVTRLATDRAAVVRDDMVDEEIRNLLRAERESGDFSRVHTAPTSPADVPDDAEARLVVLPPEQPHSRTEESLGRAFAARVLDERGGGPRLNRNMVVFLAPDAQRLEELRDGARQLIAWRSIQEEQESLNLDSVQRGQVTARIKEFEEVVKHRVGETWIWLLVPSGDAGSPELRWEETRVGGSEPLAVRASRKLRGEEGLITAYSGARLRMELDRVPLWRGDHVGTKELWGYYAQYLYLSRLRDVSVLERAIEDGVAKLDWDPGTFAYADAYDEGAGRYVGLRAGQQVTARVDPASVVVKPEAARRQFEAEAPVPAEPGKPGLEPELVMPPGELEPAEDAKPKRFYGSVAIDPLRVGRDAAEIGEHVVQHLSGLVDANVEVRLEIEAQIPDGAPDEVVRTVTENARTLKFSTQGFEPE